MGLKPAASERWDVSPLADPDLETAVATVTEGLGSGALLTVTGRCVVSFTRSGGGVADGELGPGDRTAVCKPDGTTLVHGPTGYRPAAWRPAGADVSATLAGVDEDGDPALVLTATDDDGHLEARFTAVGAVTARPVERRGTRSVSGTETDLRERVLAEPALVEAGFTPLATERTTPAGPVDIYGEDRDGVPVAVELKTGRAGPDAVAQLARYVDALTDTGPADRRVRGILVAAGVTPRARRLLAERGLTHSTVHPTSGAEDGPRP